MNDYIEKSKGFFGKIGETYRRFVSFVNETKVEMKKVSWPEKHEVVNTTIVVIATSFFFGFYLFVVDIALQAGLDKLFKHFTK